MTVPDDTPNERPEIADRIALYDSLDQAIHRNRGAAVLVFLVADEVAARAEAGLRCSDHALANLGYRLADVLEPGERLFRFSNAEYALILIKEDVQALRGAVKRVRESVTGRRFDTPGGAIGLRVDLGFQPIKQDANAEGLILRARRTATDSEPQTGDDRNEGLMDDGELWGKRIQQAIQQDRLGLVYQALVALNGEVPEHYDVLIRMFDAEGGEIPPARFLPPAEAHGLMPLIDRWVLRRTLELLAARSANGEATCLLVRLSESTVSQPDAFITQLSKELERFQLAKQRLVFSIPQGILLDHLREAKTLTRGLARLKCPLLIDRFGLEETCQRLLEELRPAYVKLHPTLAARAGDNRDRIAPIIRLAHRHKAHVIVPQVESSEALVELAKLGPDFLQGHRIQQPGPALVNKDLQAELKQVSGSP